MISRAIDAQKMNFQYTRTGATKIIPPSSLASPFPIKVQLYYNKLVVCYLYFLTSSILVLLRHDVVKQISKPCLYIFYYALLRVDLKCKKENSFRQSRAAEWQRKVLGLFCMDIIAHKGRHISCLSMNLHTYQRSRKLEVGRTSLLEHGM